MIKTVVILLLDSLGSFWGLRSTMKYQQEHKRMDGCSVLLLRISPGSARWDVRPVGREVNRKSGCILLITEGWLLDTNSTMNLYDETMRDR